MAIKRTLKVIKQAKKAGFQWPDWAGPLRKVREELCELEAEIRRRKRNRGKISEEIGDLLFSVCNLATLFGLDPEKSLHDTLDKFLQRFRFVERELRKMGKSPEQSDLQEMSSLWNRAKKIRN